jgi:hypothetical protein
MKKLILFISMPCILFSQNFPTCGYDLLVEAYQKTNPNYQKSIDYAFEVAKEWSESQSLVSDSDTLRRLPVVVHVLYQNESENISDEIIQSQIDVLNEDYRRLNADTTNTRAQFDTLAGRSNFEFFLATTDPDGNPTSGITRTSTSVESFLNETIFLNPNSDIMNSMKSPTTNGVSAWPSDKYINIWICDISINGEIQIFGYATPPNNLPNWLLAPPTSPENDGIVIHYETFGRDAVVNVGFQTAFLGRVVTHEMGHFLGLRHIWGDGPCSDDDGIDDTPFSDSNGLNMCFHNKNSCVDSPFDYHDMIENYMDYSSPSCQNIFTKGQMGLMLGVLANHRVDLPEQNVDLIPQYKVYFNVYPNPTKDLLYIESGAIESQSKLQLFDLSGKVIWEKDLLKNTFEHVPLVTSNFARGIYFLKLHSKLHISPTQKVVLN